MVYLPLAFLCSSIMYFTILYCNCTGLETIQCAPNFFCAQHFCRACKAITRGAHFVLLVIKCPLHEQALQINKRTREKIYIECISFPCSRLEPKCSERKQPPSHFIFHFNEMLVFKGPSNKNTNTL